MTIRIHNLDKWALLQPGMVLELVANDTRKIRLEFNCPADTRIDVADADGKLTFLAVVRGYEVVEFYGHATSHVVATSDDEVWYFTNDGETTATDTPEAVSFTKIAGRRERNPELERMMFKLEQNMLRRIDAERAALDQARASVGQGDSPSQSVNAEQEESADENGVADASGASGEVAGEPDLSASVPAKGTVAKS